MISLKGAVQWFGDKIVTAIHGEIDSRMDQMGKETVALARSYAPVRTGYLRDNIGYTYNAQTKVLQIHSDAPYGYFVEVGTRFMIAQPHLRPAINEASKVWGVTFEIQFPNTRVLTGSGNFWKQKEYTDSKGIKHRPVAEANRAIMLKTYYTKTKRGSMVPSKSSAATAKIINRRGKWNGPPDPWNKTWNGRPGPRPHNE